MRITILLLMVFGLFSTGCKESPATKPPESTTSNTQPEKPAQAEPGKPAEK